MNSIHRLLNKISTWILVPILAAVLVNCGGGSGDPLPSDEETSPPTLSYRYATDKLDITYSGCTNPTEDGTFSFTGVELDVLTVNSGSFNATLRASMTYDNVFMVTEYIIKGTLDSNGAVNAPFTMTFYFDNTVGTTGDGSLTGTLTDKTLSLTLAQQDKSGDTCTGSATMNLTEVPNIHQITGTVTLPASVAQQQWFVGIDTDLDGDNGLVSYQHGSVTGDTFDYTINVPAPSDYYLFAEVNLSGGQLGPWHPGDYVGEACGNRLDGTHCTVNVTSDSVFDFSLTEFKALDQPQSLIGSWRGGCITTGESNNWAIATKTYTETNYSETIDVYFDAACSTGVKGVWVHNYTYTVPSAYPGNGITINDLDLTFVNATTAVMDQDIVSYFNGNGLLCGFTNWEVAVAQDITGLDCDYLHAPAGMAFYDIYSVDTAAVPQTVRFGGQTADTLKRPTTLIDYPYVKQ